FNARDAAGNLSACSSVLSFVEDSTAPAQPQLSGTSPLSPANENTLTLSGTAEPSSTVRVYRSASCEGELVTSASVTSGGDFSVTVNVDDDSETEWTVRAVDA